MFIEEPTNELRGLWRGQGNGKWFCGDLSQVDFSNGKKIFSIMPRTPMASVYEVAPESLGECAGVRDKNKTPIFEGDIVKVLVTRCKEFEGRIGIVEWFDEAAAFVINFGHEMIYFVDHVLSDNCEVVGNVFDNPELLCQTQITNLNRIAGWNTEQIVSGMNAALNLATASGKDLASVSDIVRDNLNASGLKDSGIADKNRANRIYVIDTETTGLSPDEDEILQLSIVDESGCMVYNSLFRPERHTSWEKAEEINHITPEMVANAPTFKEMLSMINVIFSYCGTVIGYNTGFDLAFLQKAGVEFREDIKVIDVQAMFMPIAGEWDWRHNRYKWQSLVKCAEYCGYKWHGNAHDSLADALATLHCYNTLVAKKGIG